MRQRRVVGRREDRLESQYTRTPMTMAGTTNTTSASTGPNDTAPSPPDPAAVSNGRAIRTTVNIVTNTTTTAARLAWIDIIGTRFRPLIVAPPCGLTAPL